MNNTNVCYYIFLQVLSLVYELPEDGTGLLTHEGAVTDHMDMSVVCAFVHFCK